MPKPVRVSPDLAPWTLQPDMSIDPPIGGTDDAESDPAAPFSRTSAGTLPPPAPHSAPVEFGFSLTPLPQPIVGLPGGTATSAPAPRPGGSQTTAPPLPPRPGGPTSHAIDRAQEQARAADAFYRGGRLRDALLQYREAVRLNPNHAGYHAGLAIAAWRSGELGDVEHHLQEALRLAPDHPQTHDAAGLWYFEAGDLGRALFHTARATELAPDDLEIAASRAFVLEGSGQAGAAWRLVEPLISSAVAAGHLADVPTRLVVLYGRLAPEHKKVPEALEVVGRLLDPAQAATPTPLRFTAANLLERLGRYDEAFEQARLGKRDSRRPYDPRFNTERIQRRISYFTPGKLHDLPRASHRSRRPLFIVGMPRSGTTLVEQILASHPQVYGGGELTTLGQIARRAERADWAEGEGYPEYLESLSVRKADRMAREYLSAIDAMDSTAAYVTDKMPTNFVYVGLIALLFPECHVIHCTRHPLDTCVSCFMTYFASGHEFTHDLSHLGQFFRDYARVMAHWKSAVNFPIFEVKYEDVVADQEGQTRRLLEFLDLPWDERCLNYHQTHRSVATASSAQVRRPIYGSSVGRWKHYEKHLGDLVAALGGWETVGR
jgi:tetratricopeptide (TPR) repeat protein